MNQCSPNMLENPCPPANARYGTSRPEKLNKTLVLLFVGVCLSASAWAQNATGTSGQPPGAASRFTKDEAGILAAISDPYFIGHKQYLLVDEERTALLRKYSGHSEPEISKIANLGLAYCDTYPMLQDSSRGDAEAFRKFSDKWKGTVNEWVREEFKSMIGIGGGTTGSDLVRQTEEMAEGIQKAQVKSRRVDLLQTRIRLAMHNQSKELAKARNGARRDTPIALAFRIEVHEGMVWAIVTSKASIPLHHCLVYASRTQDVVKMDNQMNRDRGIAGLGMLLTGFSKEATQLNDLQGKLLVDTQKAQRGGLVFVDALPPAVPLRFQICPVGEAISIFGEAPADYTKAVSMSFWCDECNQPETQASLAPLQPPAKPRAATVPGNRGSGNFPGNRGSTNRRVDRFGFEGLKTGTLQPSSGLNR